MKKRSIANLSSLATAVALALTFGVGSASAGTFDLTVGNVNGLDCCTGPYASVTVNLVNSTTANISFDSLTNGGFIYLMAGGSAANLNVNATSFTVGTITGTNDLGGGFTPGPFTTTLNSNSAVDGFGKFNLQVNSFDGFTHSSTDIDFTLTNTSGTWANQEDVLKANFAAIHGFACAQPGCTSESGAFATGFASVPIPAAAWLLGSGLIGFLGIARRKVVEA
jgi:hypothetical protein